MFVVGALWDEVGAGERKLFAEKVCKFPREIVHVTLVDVRESEFVDDGEKKAY